MTDDERARQLWELGTERLSEGEVQQAVELFEQSIAAKPTAEGYTFHGWALSYLGRFAEATEDCKRAIQLDPDFGNPYNDIGVYLIDLDRYDEAIPWLEQAMTATRYEPRHFPYFNLGRVYLAKGMINRARELFQKSLAIEPRYTLARQALESVRRMVN